MAGKSPGEFFLPPSVYLVLQEHPPIHHRQVYVSLVYCCVLCVFSVMTQSTERLTGCQCCYDWQMYWSSIYATCLNHWWPLTSTRIGWPSLCCMSLKFVYVAIFSWHELRIQTFHLTSSDSKW